MSPLVLALDCFSLLSQHSLLLSCCSYSSSSNSSSLQPQQQQQQQQRQVSSAAFCRFMCLLFVASDDLPGFLQQQQ